jgi:hypothetical protein
MTSTKNIHILQIALGVTLFATTIRSAAAETAAMSLTVAPPNLSAASPVTLFLAAKPESGLGVEDDSIRSKPGSVTASPLAVPESSTKAAVAVISLGAIIGLIRSHRRQA